MKTPSTNANVIVSGPAYDLNDKTIVEDDRYDCLGFATQSYSNFNYLITGGSLWDVLNDGAIAHKVIHNEPVVTPNTSSLVRGDASAEDIAKISFPVGDARRMLKDDIVVFWGFSGQGESTYWLPNMPS